MTNDLFGEVAKSVGPKSASTILDTDYGCLKVEGHPSKKHAEPLLSLRMPDEIGSPTFVRLHSACMFGESFHSNLCDCRQQLDAAIQQVVSENGVIIYLPQEGRGAGLCAKIAAMEIERLKEIDTVSAFEELGLSPDLRDYSEAVRILKSMGVAKEIRLMTNNPNKIRACSDAGFKVVERLEPFLELPDRTRRIVEQKRVVLSHLSKECKVAGSPFQPR